jgi:hypothetical protein
VSKRSRTPKKPHAKKKAAKRELSPDEQWAVDIRERVLADCHPFQRWAVLCILRFIALLVGRGGGKTTTMRARAIIKLTAIRRGKLLYIAPTRDMARELMWEPLKASLEHYGLLPDFEFNESRLVCTCKRTGATLKLVGLDDQAEVDKLRGQPWDEVYCDEASLYKATLLSNLLDRSLGPRLGERNGTIVLGGTPGHILSGPFYDYTRPGSPLHVPFADLKKPEHAEWDGYVSFTWTLEDVANLPNAEKLYTALCNLWREALAVKKRNGWSDQNPIWLREYKGKWAADETGMVFQYRPHLEDGKPWNQWDPFGELKLEGLQALQVAFGKLREMFPQFKDWRFVNACDKGSTDPFAANIFAFAPADPERQLWHVMPFERTKMYMRQWAEMMLGAEAVLRMLTGKPLEPLGGIYAVTGWPDAAVFDSDQATIDELANVYGVRFKKADRNPYSKKGAIELTNGDFVDGRLKIIKGSPLEQQLQLLQWAEDRNGQLIENKAQANHSTDTLVYGRKEVAVLYESGVAAQDTSGAGAYSDPMGLGASADEEIPGRRDENGDLLTDPTLYDDSWG